ncbi:hypothetical protein FVE85_6888 [Porphyridium purpureum]|uniref:Uncharacterized protein n=1 Tax=Porphyridium purpureum TaxID=35688 RepID=A0A5J4Z962_PORPP|nr:hypothetical protein FVE85_6888 [Porphyridium purpureum]|eukprot:POR8375..scf295_1
MFPWFVIIGCRGPCLAVRQRKAFRDLINAFVKSVVPHCGHAVSAHPSQKAVDFSLYEDNGSQRKIECYDFFDFICDKHAKELCILLSNPVANSDVNIV